MPFGCRIAAERSVTTSVLVPRLLSSISIVAHRQRGGSSSGMRFIIAIFSSRQNP